MYFVNTVNVEQRFPTWDTPDFHPFMIYTKIFNKNVVNNFEYSQREQRVLFYLLMGTRAEKRLGTTVVEDKQKFWIEMKNNNSIIKSIWNFTQIFRGKNVFWEFYWQFGFSAPVVVCRFFCGSGGIRSKGNKVEKNTIQYSQKHQCQERSGDSKIIR